MSSRFRAGKALEKETILGSKLALGCGSGVSHAKACLQYISPSSTLISTHDLTFTVLNLFVPSDITYPTPVVVAFLPVSLTFPMHLSHGLQEISLLDAGPSLRPQCLRQLPPRIPGPYRTLQRPITSRHIHRLFMERHLGGQQLWIRFLLFSEAFRRETTLFLGFRYNVSLATMHVVTDTREHVRLQDMQGPWRRVCMKRGSRNKTYKTDRPRQPSPPSSPASPISPITSPGIRGLP